MQGHSTPDWRVVEKCFPTPGSPPAGLTGVSHGFVPPKPRVGDAPMRSVIACQFVQLHVNHGRNTEVHERPL